MDKLIVKHSGIVVPNYELGEVPNLESKLSTFDSVYFKERPMAYDYDEEASTLYIPRGMNISEVEEMTRRKAEYDFECNDIDKALIRLQKEPKNTIQQRSIAYLLGEGDFKYTKTKSQLALNLDTGDGKTYCVIAALSFMREKSLIMTHIDNIKQQWIESLKKFTDTIDDFILDVKGSKVIEKVMKIPSNKLPWKTYLVNRKTLNSYAKKHGWQAVDEFIKHIKVGVKVFDEAHIEFETMMNIDFHSNVKKTIYLTANFERSEFKENIVFKHSFDNIPKFGISTRNEKERHIVYVPTFFNTKPSMEAKMSMRGIKGWLDKNKYSDYLTDKDKFYEVLKTTMDMCIENPGRILILTSKISSTEDVAAFIKETYPDLQVGVYNSSIDSKLKEEIKESYPIISSTPKSMGTGTDLPGLRYVLNFDVYSSSVMANQISGRLRELPNGDNTFFFEFIDSGIPDITKMYKKRLPIFKKKCKLIKQINL